MIAERQRDDVGTLIFRDAPPADLPRILAGGHKIRHVRNPCRATAAVVANADRIASLRRWRRRLRLLDGRETAEITLAVESSDGDIVFRRPRRAVAGIAAIEFLGSALIVGNLANLHCLGDAADIAARVPAATAAAITGTTAAPNGAADEPVLRLENAEIRSRSAVRLKVAVQRVALILAAGAHRGALAGPFDVALPGKGIVVPIRRRRRFRARHDVGAIGREAPGRSQDDRRCRDRGKDGDQQRRSATADELHLFPDSRPQ